MLYAIHIVYSKYYVEKLQILMQSVNPCFAEQKEQIHALHPTSIMKGGCELTGGPSDPGVPTSPFWPGVPSTPGGPWLPGVPSRP